MTFSDTRTDIQVFCGSEYYTMRKTDELKRFGYVVVRKTRWSDGKYTIKMEKDPE